MKDGLYHAVSRMALLVRPFSSKRLLRGGLPDLIENSGRECRLILRKEAPVVVGNHFRRVLDGITCLLVRAGLLQNMGCKYVGTLCGPCGSRPLIAPRPV